MWRRTFTTGRHTGVPIEPRSLVADFEPATRSLTVWMSTQVPHMMQAVLADLFDLPEQRVRVVAPDVGGSFGIKIHVYQDDLAACALAIVLGRPVKWVASRRESFLSDIHAREQTIEVAVGADADGTLTGMRARIVAAVGPYSAFPRSSVVEGGQVLRLLPGPYRLRHYDGALSVVAQNKVVTSQYRAVGHPIAAAVTESLLDQIARDLGLDPAEIRRRNLVRPEDLPWSSPTGNVYDSGSYQAALARLLEVARYDELRREQAKARAEGRSLGIGLACFLELTGPGAQFYGVGGAPISGQDGATLRLQPSGTVTALVGVTNQGQGTTTALAQIIADELAVPVEAITVLAGDTGVTPYGGGTWASRGMPIGGSATLLAARALAQKIRAVAGVLLEAHPDDIALAEARASVRGAPGRALGYAELARIVHFRSNALKGLEPSLEATVHYTNPQAWTFTNGAHLAVVELDLETGRVRVVRYVAVDDCARRRPDRRRRRPGHRRRALRALRLRRRRPAPHGDADGLRGADRGRSAGLRAAPSGDARALDRRRLQGRRRGRHHRRSRRHPQRGQRRPGAVRRDALGAAHHGRARPARARAPLIHSERIFGRCPHGRADAAALRARGSRPDGRREVLSQLRPDR